MTQKLHDTDRAMVDSDENNLEISTAISLPSQEVLSIESGSFAIRVCFSMAKGVPLLARNKNPVEGVFCGRQA